MQKVAVRWQSKTFRGNVASRAGSIICLLSLAHESLRAVCLYLVCGAKINKRLRMPLFCSPLHVHLSTTKDLMLALVFKMKLVKFS